MPTTLPSSLPVIGCRLAKLNLSQWQASGWLRRCLHRSYRGAQKIADAVRDAAQHDKLGLNTFSGSGMSIAFAKGRSEAACYRYAIGGDLYWRYIVIRQQLTVELLDRR